MSLNEKLKLECKVICSLKPSLKRQLKRGFGHNLPGSHINIWCFINKPRKSNRISLWGGRFSYTIWLKRPPWKRPWPKRSRVHAVAETSVPKTSVYRITWICGMLCPYSNIPSVVSTDSTQDQHNPNLTVYRQRSGLLPSMILPYRMRHFLLKLTCTCEDITQNADVKPILIDRKGTKHLFLCFKDELAARSVNSFKYRLAMLNVAKYLVKSQYSVYAQTHFRHNPYDH